MARSHAAIDGARVGLFELRDAQVQPTIDAASEPLFDVYLDMFDVPLITGASASEADVETRKFASAIAASVSVLSPSSPFASGSSRPSSKRRRSKQLGRRAKLKVPNAVAVVGFLCVVALTSVFSYYFGTTQIPGTDTDTVIY